MPPKGIDYSKWEKIAVSSSDDEDAAANAETFNDDDDDDNGDADDAEAVIHKRAVPNPSSSSSAPAVRKLDGPSTVTFGGGRHDVQVTVKEPSLGTTPSAATSAAPAEVGDVASAKKPKLLRNGCLIAESGIFWSQTADSVAFGLILESYSLADFLASQQQPQQPTMNSQDGDDGSSIDSAVRQWNSRHGAKKVQRVSVSSVQHQQSEGNESSGLLLFSHCLIEILLSDASRSTFILAYDAQPLDPDEFWGVQLLAYSDLGLPSPASAFSSPSLSSPVLAVRAVVVELKKKATNNLVSSVKHWWSQLLTDKSNYVNTGKIDVQRDIDDRRDSEDKRLAMKKAWDEAHEIFKQRVQERKKKGSGAALEFE